MHRVDDDQGRQLAAGQDVVPDRDLEVDEGADPLVDALVARAEEDRGGPSGQVVGPAWRKTLAGRVEQDRPSNRAAAARRAPPRPAPAAGPCPRPRRTCSRRRSGGARAPSGAGRGPARSRGPRSWIRPGMLSASGPSTIAGKRVRTSISRSSRRLGASRDRRARPARRSSRSDAPSAPRARRTTRRRSAASALELERLRVDDDLAPPRREDPDEGRTPAGRTRRTGRRTTRPRRRRRGRRPRPCRARARRRRGPSIPTTSCQ